LPSRSVVGTPQNTEEVLKIVDVQIDIDSTLRIFANFLIVESKWDWCYD
jgi:hypothetical protein